MHNTKKEKLTGLNFALLDLENVYSWLLVDRKCNTFERRTNKSFCCSLLP